MGSFKAWQRTFHEIYTQVVIPCIPSKRLRIVLLRLLGAKIGKNVSFVRYPEIRKPSGLFIEGNCSIGKGVLLDARSGLKIEKGVTISSYVLIWTLHHDYNDIGFKAVGEKVVIESYAWICSRAIILPGITIGRGAVIAAGAVVTKDVEPFAIMGGVPARKIGVRENKDYNYIPSYKTHIL